MPNDINGDLFFQLDEGGRRGHDQNTGYNTAAQAPQPTDPPHT